MLQEVGDILCYSATFLVYLQALLEQLRLSQWHRRSWSSSVLLASEWGLSKLNTASRKASAPVAGKTVWAQGILLNLICCKLTPTFDYWFGYWGWERGLQSRKHFLGFGSAEVWGWGGWFTAVPQPTRSPTRILPQSPPHPNLLRVPRRQSQLTCGKAPNSSVWYKYTETIWSIRVIISLQRFRNSVFISCNHFRIFIEVNSCKYSTQLCFHTNLSAVWFGIEGTISTQKKKSRGLFGYPLCLTAIQWIMIMLWQSCRLWLAPYEMI